MMPLIVLYLLFPAILNPKQPKENKSFNFDYSYWSHTTVSPLERTWRGPLPLVKVDTIEDTCTIPTHHLGIFSFFLSAARRHQLRVPDAGVQGHWRRDAASRLRGIQCVHICVRSDRSRQKLHHDGAAGEGPAGDHSSGNDRSRSCLRGNTNRTILTCVLVFL